MPAVGISYKKQPILESNQILMKTLSIQFYPEGCVEMGLGMISAMRLFDTKRQEGVNMRVGIHTGTVLCGIVGTKRVKFDVWSNDVSLANRMESTGKPGQVHVSEETFSFLDDEYVSEPGEDVEGKNAHFHRN